ncbi:MAG: thiamine pyrophosphate-binding protein [Betaproteobacteria bacterium]|nr:thiamine pyrophosphate-binding protein [Betaproteobacteria bacterium]
MSVLNGGQIIAKQLKREGIDTVFAVYAGPMTQALAGLADESVRVVGCRHEEQAGFMAQAWGYINKKPGIVIAGSGPAVSNTVTSLQVATDSGLPLVVLGGSAGASTHSNRPTRAFGGFQETDQVALTTAACKWAVEVDVTDRIPEFLHIGLGKAVSGRPGGVYIDFPGHLVQASVPEENVQWRETQPAVYQPHGDPAGVEAIAKLLAEAERPLILVGKGAAWADAAESLQKLAAMGIPFVASPMGRGTIPDDDPRNAGSARSSALRNADAVLMAGGRFNWIFQFGRPPTFASNAKFAHIDIVPEEMTSAANIDIGLVADCAAATGQIVEALAGRRLRTAATGWLTGLQEQAQRNRAALNEIMASDSVPISPYRLVRDVRDSLARDATISVDGEITLGIGRLILPSYYPRHRLNSGTTACMGTGVPYAIGAKLARPDLQSVAVLGDYAFGASAMEIETAARMNAAVVFVIVNNAGIVGRSAQQNTFGFEEPLISGLIPADYEKMAEMVGGYAEKVEDPAEIKPAIGRALESGKVSLLNVMVDPKGGVRRGGGYL